MTQRQHEEVWEAKQKQPAAYRIRKTVTFQEFVVEKLTKGKAALTKGKWEIMCSFRSEEQAVERLRQIIADEKTGPRYFAADGTELVAHVLFDGEDT